MGNTANNGEIGFGGGFDLYGGAPSDLRVFELSNLNVVSNLVGGSDRASGAAHGIFGGGSITYTANNVFDNQGGGRFIGYMPNFDNLLEISPGYTDISSADPTEWDLTLSPDSLLRTAGDPDVQNADGSRSDVGAYGGPHGNGW